MNYIYKFQGGELECELHYEPAERGSREIGTGLQLEPDEPAVIYLQSATFNGVDFFELLSDSVVDLIEIWALAEMEGAK